MDDVIPSPVRVEVAGGFVNSTERLRAHEMVGSVCGRARRARGRVVLVADTDSTGSPTASADAILVLDDYRLLCAGAVATTPGDAIEALESRLQFQVFELGEREHALRQFIRHGHGEQRSSRQAQRAGLSR